MEKQYQAEIQLKKIDILYQHANLVIVGLLCLAVAVILFIHSVMWPEHINSHYLYIWLSVYAVICCLRLYGITLYNRDTLLPDRAVHWLHIYMFGIVTSGVLWGILFLYLIKFLDSPYHNFVIYFMEGIVSAAVATYATSLLAFVLAATTLVGPVTIYFVLHPDPSMNHLGYFLIVYLVFLILVTRKLNNTLTGYLVYEFNANKLEREKHYATLVNRELEEEILKRINTEGKLKSEINRAEALANKLIDISSKDGLTGINNRRCFDEYLRNEWNRLARSSSHLSLIMCDIDFYKAFNDAYGHLSGDDCLKKIAQILEHYSRRAGDLAARYGGEEFVLLLPGTHLSNAAQVAEDIRNAVEELQIPHKLSEINDYVTISLGVATVVPSRDENPSILIKLADDALYAAKRGGRNMVMAHGVEKQHSVTILDYPE